MSVKTQIVNDMGSAPDNNGNKGCLRGTKLHCFAAVGCS